MLAARPLRSHRQKPDSARDVLRRRGGSAVFVGRFTAFLRAVTPALAGPSRMPYATFLAFNASGALVCGVGVTLLGYSAGASFAGVESVLGLGSAALITVNAVNTGAARQAAESIRRLGAKVILSTASS